MAQITKRGPAQWRVRIRRQGQPDLSRTFDFYENAVSWAREIEHELDRGVYVSRKEAERTTLSEAIERYLIEFADDLADPIRVRNRAKALLRRRFVHKALAAIRGKDVAEFIRARKNEGVGPNTIRLEISLISRVFNIARKSWGMEGLDNPVRNVIRPRPPAGRSRRLEEDEEGKLLVACSRRFALVVRFALATAMRRSEIAELTWDRVDLARRSVLLARTKNGEARTVPLAPEALEVLRVLPRRIGKASVFSFTAQGMTRSMTKASRKAGLEDFHFHDLRHEATSRLFERTDLDVMEIRSITGHKSLAMLVRYTHLRASRLADRLAGMERGR